MLSPIVHDNNSFGSHEDEKESYSYFQRTHWGFVTLAIESGISVSFRKPTDFEIEAYEKRLENIRGMIFNDSEILAYNDFPIFTINEDGPGLTLKEGLNAVFQKLKDISE